jgi:putative membrane-bound dehydrogenase-like protein
MWMRMCGWLLSVALVGIGLILTSGSQSVGQEFIPRKQTKPPGPALSPEEALSRMEVPEGFRVELVASEPQIMNPVAMAFDDAGRIFVTESFEYPRHEPGPGRDRIKILEDTDGDGKVDKVKVFAEGLNIPSGIAVGHGGVWVANAPDILFLEDTDGDDVADRQTVVVTGFGRIDTHELPNALTWGPDGYLYGLNGVFNPSVVEQGGSRYEFTCAMFRIDPKTKRFDLFCEGTSNPWGIAFDSLGSAFISACVIDHLWHLTESAYYLRQGGPYPPHTWWAESIVKHKHQMAAYCGIEYFDSEAYPESYRGKLYMGNIHGGCINTDRIERFGATYQGFGEPDFLTANDVWFMPVAQKVGPDGCLYILDWYDRYHCYQDASADPKGVDRGHGRLYRVVYGDRPLPRYRDISKLTNAELIVALSDSNIYVRQRAQLQLAQRSESLTLEERTALEELGLQGGSQKIQLQAIWALASAGAGVLRGEYVERLLEQSDPEIRAWAVRLIGDHFSETEQLLGRCAELARDPDERVRLQVAIAAPKLHFKSIGPKEIMDIEMEVLAHTSDDPISRRVIWQNCLPFADEARGSVLAKVEDRLSVADDPVRAMLPRFVGKWIDTAVKEAAKQEVGAEVQSVERLLDDLFTIAEKIRVVSAVDAAEVLRPVLARVHSGELALGVLRPILERLPSNRLDSDWESLVRTLATKEGAWSKTEIILGLLRGDKGAESVSARLVMGSATPIELRKEIMTLSSRRGLRLAGSALRDALLERVARYGAPKAQWFDNEAKFRDEEKWYDFVVDMGVPELSANEVEELGKSVSKLSLRDQSVMAEKMSQREVTAKTLLDWMARGLVRKEILSPNSLRLLATKGSEEIKSRMAKVYGVVRTEEDPERDRVVKRMTEQVRGLRGGDAQRGWLVYDRICGQCHLMHGRGVEVGPNITANGRGNYEQLLVSIFNPSLVIGDAYRSVTIRTKDETVYTGLLVSRDGTKTVIKTQGGKEVTVLADDIETYQQDKKSLMPEGIESQLSESELADLFALLTLEKAPGSEENGTILGTPQGLHRKEK